MTEKRFECYDLIFDGFIKDTLTNENIVEPIKLIHLLNEQDKKIKELEKENDTLRMITGKELFKEIDNLKKDIQQLEKENAEAHHLNLLANGFIIEKGLAKEFLKWSKEND